MHMHPHTFFSHTPPRAPLWNMAVEQTTRVRKSVAREFRLLVLLYIHTYMWHLCTRFVTSFLYAERGVQFYEYRISPMRNLCLSSALCGLTCRLSEDVLNEIFCPDIISYNVFVAIRNWWFRAFWLLIRACTYTSSSAKKHRGIDAYDVRKSLVLTTRNNDRNSD